MREPRAIAALITASAIFVSACAPAAAQDHTVRTAKVVAEACASGSTPASREEALRRAREEAVWLWLNGTLGLERSSAFEPLMAYLDTYTASSRLTHVNVDRGLTCVEAEVFLYEWPLRTDAAAVLIKSRRTPPSVAFLLIEDDSVIGARRFQEGTALAESLVETFGSKGLRVVPPAAARNLFGERELLAMIESGPAAVARFGSDLNADAVVSIESRLSARNEGRTPGTLRARAELSMFVVNTVDAAVFDKANAAAEVSAADAQSGIQFALDDAVYKIRDRMVVAAVLAARDTPADRFDLTVEDVRDLDAAERIADGLRALPGLADANVLTARNGVARIRFHYAGRISNIVEFLESGGAGPRLSAVRVVDRELYFRLGP